MLERDIQRRILIGLRARGIFAFKVITANRNGIPDIIACVEGRFVAFEVKRPHYKPTRIQQGQIKRIQDAGGEAYVVYSLEDVLNYLHIS